MPDGDIFRPFYYSPNERDVGWKIQGILCISIGLGLASPPFRPHLDKEVFEAKIYLCFLPSA